MGNPEDFKNKIERLISQDYKVEFLGKNFDQIISLLTDTKIEKIYKWIGDVVTISSQSLLDQKSLTKNGK